MWMRGHLRIIILLCLLVTILALPVESAPPSNDDFTGTWTHMTAGAEWSARESHSSVAMPDGSIILMGGTDSGGCKNDVWRSTDKGATWTQQTASAGWSARTDFSSVALPDGSIVLMGGFDGNKYMNDVWRSTDKGGH